MTCDYIKTSEGKIIDVKSSNDIIKEFYKDTQILTNSAIFSSDEIQNSVREAILKIPNINTYYSEDELKAKGLTGVREFNTQDNSTLYAARGLTIPPSGRAVPEYIAEERCFTYVKDKIAKVAGLSDDVDISGLKPLKNFDFVKKKLEERKIVLSDNKIKLLLSEIEGEIETEDKTKVLGTSIHELISHKLKGDVSRYESKINSFLSDPENAELLGTASKDEWRKKIDSIVESVVDSVNNHGVTISEIFLESLVSDVKVRGKLDLIAIDTNGFAHIFEIKLSKHKYDDWDSAKLRDLDWQLAMYRQLLGQHIPIANTRLYTIPIEFSEFGNPGSLILGDLQDRTAQNSRELGPSGTIKHRASKFIPEKIIITYDSEREADLFSDLDTLIDGFKIKTEIDDFNIEKAIEYAESKIKSAENSKYRMHSKFKDIDGVKIVRGYIEADSKEEFVKMLKLYEAHLKEQVNSNVVNLTNAIVSALKNKTKIKTGNDTTDLNINKLLNEFLNDDWELVEGLKEAIAFGVIIFRNKTTGNVNIVSLTANNLMASYDEDYSVLYSDLEIWKNLLFVNNLKNELFPGFTGKLDKIIVFNGIMNDSKQISAIAAFESFRNRMNKVGLGDKVKLSENSMLSLETSSHSILNSHLKAYEGSPSELKDIKDIFNIKSDDDILAINDKDLDELIEIQKNFYKKFPQFREFSLKPEMNFENKNEMLLALLQVLIVTKSGDDMSGDFRNMSKFSLNFSDFKSLFAALFSDKQATYDREGRRIQGIVRGLVFSPPDWISSKDLKNINSILSSSNQSIRKQFFRAHEKISKHTTEYYRDINFSSVSRNVVGETQSKHANLFIQKNGKVADEFVAKNPYIENQENILSDAERKYLKRMLLIINQYKLNLTNEEVEKLDPEKLSSLQSNDKIASAIESGKYFEMPLVRREELSKYGAILEDTGTSWKQSFKQFGHEINDFIDTKELEPDALEDLKKSKMGYYEMYDAYGRQSKNYKAKVIKKHGVDYFEFNLDTIAHRIAFNKIRKNVYDVRLPIINAHIWWMKLLAGKENIDISNQLEYVANQLSLSAYDDSIIDPEFKDLSIITSALKTVSTAGMLAFKPLALVKELSVGTIKGIMMASTKVFGTQKFDIGNLAMAYGKLIRIDNKFSNEFNLIDKLNQYYGIANMDVNSIAQKMQSDRRGAMRGLSRWMYASNTVPDYYNRLAVFLAIMDKDGSYDAHSIDENGKFKYDPTKDERFKYYFENREKYKSGDFYTSAPGDNKFNEQRRKYLLHIQLLNKELTDKKYTEKDLVEDAYSETERKAVKTMSDMAYGYYDKDTQAHVTNTWYGIAFMQFMQFWPGKMTMWFAKPEQSSALGEIQQDFVEKDDGTKVLLWNKEVIDEDGNIKTVSVEENTGDPCYKWVSTPYEGLAYSMLGTARDLVKLDFKNIKSKEMRTRRALYGVGEGILVFLILGIVKAMFDAYVSENGTEGLTNHTISMMGRVNNKVMNEYNIWQSTLGAINTTPTFISWGNKLGGDILDVFEGDKNVSDLMKRNVGAAEIFKD